MSTPSRTPCTRAVVFAFLEFLRDETNALSQDNPDQVDLEGIEVASQCLAEAFNVDVESAADRAHLSQAPFFSLPEALGMADRASGYEARFGQFVASLRERGLFDNVAEGTPAFNKRMEKAKQRFEDKYRTPVSGFYGDGDGDGDASAAPAPATAAAAAPSTPSEEDKARALEHKNAGNQLLTSGKHREAIAEYSAAIRLDPSNHVFFGNRAAAYLGAEDYQLSVADGLSATKLDPTYVKAWVRLGRAYQALNQHEKAIEALLEADELTKSNPAQNQRIQSLLQKSRSASAPQQAPAGGLDLNALLSNPAVMQMMQDPNMMNLASQFMGGGGAPAPSSGPSPSASSTPSTPATPSDRMQEILQMPEVQELRNDPEVAPVFEALEANGPMAIMPFMSNPSIMAKLNPVMSKIMSSMNMG